MSIPECVLLYIPDTFQKRKAQNRAAQRAFRERKEKHLKDLEVKVNEMSKSAEAANQENGVLRAQVARLQAELNDYRKRMAADRNRPAASVAAPAAGATRNEFAFDFPAFGSLPTSAPFVKNAKNPTLVKRESIDSSISNTAATRQGSSSQSPYQATNGTPSNGVNGLRKSSSQASASMQSFAGLFSPTILNAASSPDYGFPKASNSPQPIADVGSDTNSGLQRVFRFNSESAASNSQSPSQASLSPFNPTSSSCNTSPGASGASPPKDDNAMSSSSLGNSPPNPLSAPSPYGGIDWMASQNGGQFDPVLFGDYRESQDAVVGDGDFKNGFFNDAYPLDFGSPLNLDVNSPQATSTSVPRAAAISDGKSATSQQLLAQINETVNGVSDDFGLPPTTTTTAKPAPSLPVLPVSSAEMLNANTIWDRLQANQGYKDGLFDLDELCSELRQKAVCSETGCYVPADIVESQLKKLGGTDKPFESLTFERNSVDEALQKLGAKSGKGGGLF